MFYSSLEYKVQLILESVDEVKPSIQTMELQWFSICPTGEVCVLPVTMHCNNHATQTCGSKTWKI